MAHFENSSFLDEAEVHEEKITPVPRHKGQCIDYSVAEADYYMSMAIEMHGLKSSEVNDIKKIYKHYNGGTYSPQSYRTPQKRQYYKNHSRWDLFTRKYYSMHTLPNPDYIMEGRHIISQFLLMISDISPDSVSVIFCYLQSPEDNYMFQKICTNSYELNIL
jgi:hypothetical protein